MPEHYGRELPQEVQITSDFFHHIMILKKNNNEKCSQILYPFNNSKDIIPKAIKNWNTELSLHLNIKLMFLAKSFIKICFERNLPTNGIF